MNDLRIGASARRANFVCNQIYESNLMRRVGLIADFSSKLDVALHKLLEDLAQKKAGVRLKNVVVESPIDTNDGCSESYQPFGLIELIKMVSD